MGTESEGLVGKVKDTIGSVLSGNPDNLPRADEDPDIEYPEPLDQEYIDDGRMILTKRSDQEDEDDRPGEGTDDAVDAGQSTG